MECCLLVLKMIGIERTLGDETSGDTQEAMVLLRLLNRSSGLLIISKFETFTSLRGRGGGPARLPRRDLVTN